MLKPSLFACAPAASSLSHAARGQGAAREARPPADSARSGAISLSDSPDLRAGPMPARVARLPQPAGPGYHGPALVWMRPLAGRSEFASASLRF